MNGVCNIHSRVQPCLSGFMVWGPSVTTRGHIWCFRRVNSACYIAQVNNPELLLFLRQEGDVLFKQDNVHPHTAASTQRALPGVRRLPWPATSPDLSPIRHIMGHKEAATCSSSRACRKHCRIATSARMTFGTFMTVCMREYRHFSKKTRLGGRLNPT